MNQHKVLLDLSTILSGDFPFSGIPQEARVLFKLFSQNEGIKPVGLICSQSRNSALGNYKVQSDNVKQALAYTNYLTGLEDPAPKLLPRVLRIYQLLKILRKAFFQKNYYLHAFDAQYGDYIWRKAFNGAVDGKLRDLILSQEFVLSDFNKYILSGKIMLNLPLPKLHTEGMDFAIFQHGLPQMPLVSKGTIPIVRFHDAVPLLFPETVDNFRYSKLHAKSILASSKHAVFVCNSAPVQKELIDLLPGAEKISHVIPVPLLIEGEAVEKNYDAIPVIVESRQVTGRPKKQIKKNPTAPAPYVQISSHDYAKMDWKNYVISVSTLEPRKNFLALVRAWERTRSLHDKKLKLVIVGSPGWKCKDVTDAMAPHIRTGDIIHLEHVPLFELRMLYACARAFIFPTYYEGFGNTPVEAMHSGCPVIVSDIPATRWVLGDAALYCNPYDINSISDAMARLLYSTEGLELSEKLIKKGHEAVKKYSSEVVGNQWRDLFEKLKSKA